MARSRTPRWSARLARKYLLVALAVVVIVLATCGAALADEATAGPANVPAVASFHGDARQFTTTRWFGWQTLIADGASLTIVPAFGAVAKRGVGGTF